MDKPKKVKKTINGKTTIVTLKPSSIKEALKYGGAKMKKYGKGGPTEPEKTQPKGETTKSESPAAPAATSSASRSSQLGSMTGKQYRQEKRGVKREAKLERIKSGKQGDRVDNVIKAVGAGAEAVANVTDAVNSVRGGMTPRQKMGGRTKSTYKTGGMVNSNAKVSALKSAGSKGVKSGVNLKAAVSKIAKGRVGGTSTAPKKAVPQAKMGGAMKRKSC
jgi:hypothetical protein